ncbi:MAG: heparinase II/III family protein [Sphingomonadales bacterium]
MSLLERIGSPSGGQEIEQGKRLIRVDDQGLGLSDILSYCLRRLNWRVPFGGIQMRGPVKLLAVPKDPVAGDRAAGEALLHGRIVHGEESLDVETLDFAKLAVSPSFADYLHSFEWLRDLAAAATREKGARLAEKIVRHWLDAYAAARTDDATWRPDLWGRRILFWTAYAPYVLSSRDPAYRSVLLNALSRGARHLERTADKARQGLPRLRAWAGVIASAVVVQSGPTRLGRGETGFARTLDASLHDDGGLTSRSPIEQLGLVELLGQLRTIYYAGRRDMPERLQEALPAAVSALLGVTLGDEALSSWQGGNMLSKRRVAAAVEASGVEARPLRQARGWGYQRLACRTSVAVLDGAPPPAMRAFAGGCASTLAFEFSDGAERVIVNCGGAGSWTGALPAELAHLLRYTAAHSTLTLGDRNSTAILQDGTLGKGVTQVELSRDETGGISRVEASHDGYVRRFGLLHERELILSADGRELRGEDNLLPQGRKRRSEPVPFAVRFHLAPPVEVTSTADGQGALLRLRGGSAWQFKCRGGALGIEESLWIDGMGRAHRTAQLVVAGESPPGGMGISWQLRRAS